MAPDQAESTSSAQRVGLATGASRTGGCDVQAVSKHEASPRVSKIFISSLIWSTSLNPSVVCTSMISVSKNCPLECVDQTPSMCATAICAPNFLAAKSKKRPSTYLLGARVILAYLSTFIFHLTSYLSNAIFTTDSSWRTRVWTCCLRVPSVWFKTDASSWIRVLGSPICLSGRAYANHWMMSAAGKSFSGSNMRGSQFQSELRKLIIIKNCKIMN